MAMPAVPGAGFVVIKAEFVLGGFKAVLDGPAMAFHRHQLLHGRAPWGTMSRKAKLPSAMLRRIRRPPRPFPGEAIIVFTDLQIGQLETGPLVPARTFRAFAGRQ